MKVLLRVLIYAMAPAAFWALSLDAARSADAETTAVSSAPAAAPVAAPSGAMEMPPGGLPPGVTPEMLKKMMRGGTPGGPPGVAPGGPPNKPGEPGKTPDGAKTFKRPAKPPTPPNPAELKVRPVGDKVGMLNFNGQPWLDVLDWVADISGMSLDYQELPGDSYNLTTRRAYTVREVRDLINRDLLARGYTMLRNGERLTVVEVKKLEKSLVPRLAPEQLDERDPYEFVKVSFPLDSMLADTAKTELKPMLSDNGKIEAMSDTNRVEVMDAVTNLRDVWALLKKEQASGSQKRLFQKFKLHYARAVDVRDVLHNLLGIEEKPGGAKPPQTPEQAQQQQMMMMQRMQQQGGQPGQPGQPDKPPGGGPPGPVSVVANERENSILASAPPDKMAMIEQIITALDIESDQSQSALLNMNRMQVYRLTGIDPAPVVKTLEQIGNLSPMTHLEVDAKNHAIIATGPLIDHVTIRALVERLSGSERKFYVKPLRRLRADDVAGSILFMMGIEPKKKKDSSNRYYGWSPWGSSQQTETEKPNEFRVDADVEHNRLLLWANDVELRDVEDLLVKLGEIPPKNGNRQAVRVLDAGGEEETQELLDRIRRAWPDVAPNPLALPPAATKKEAPEPRRENPKPKDEPLPSATAAVDPSDRAPLRLAADSDNRPRTEKAPPPVTVTIDPDGRLILSSEDTRALDMFEELAGQLSPPRKDYQTFRLRRASAYTVAGILEDFFREEKKGQSWRPWYWDSNQEETDDEMRLSKRRKLRFVSDSETNTVVVVGADAQQLKTIQELIDLYDQPPPEDSEMKRRTETIHLRFAKAKAVAETVKEVYRDLLSENDKALADGNRQRGQSNVYFYDVFGGDSDKGESKQPKFKGLLSMGIDETSNSLVVSAPAFLFAHLERLITELDTAAGRNNSVRVVKVGPGVSAAKVQAMLDALQNPGAGRTASTPEGAGPPKTGKGKNGAKSSGNGGDSNGKS